MSLNFKDRLLVLAPLAGFTDLPFRAVVREFGVDLTISEMISSNALLYNSKKTLKMLQKSKNETPYSVQLAGNSKDTIKGAVEILNNIEGIDCIDLNCGCPAKKVVSHGSGSALLKDLTKLREILSTIKNYSNKRYTSAKIRIGFDKKIPLEIAKAIEDSGADFIAVHGRTKVDGYKKEAIDYDSIALIKQNISIPTIANGEIDSYRKAKEVFEITKADGVMIGRGAIGNPWIFEQIKQRSEEVDFELKRAIILSHFDKMVDFYGDIGVVMFRKHLHTYSKSHKDASNFRDIVNRVDSKERARELILDFFKV